MRGGVWGHKCKHILVGAFSVAFLVVKGHDETIISIGIITGISIMAITGIGITDQHGYHRHH